MNDKLTQQEINQAAWAACDTFRGAVDPAQYKDYILVMLFLKYISDLWNDHFESYKKQFGGDDVRIRRRMERERIMGRRPSLHIGKTSEPSRRSDSGTARKFRLPAPEIRNGSRRCA